MWRHGFKWPALDCLLTGGTSLTRCVTHFGALLKEQVFLPLPFLMTGATFTFHIIFEQVYFGSFEHGSETKVAICHPITVVAARSA